MMQNPRHKITLATLLALTGTFAMPQVGMAQVRQPSNAGLGSVDEGIMPYTTPNTLNPLATGDDGSARDATGQSTPVNVTNPYTTQYANGTEAVWNGDGSDTPYRRETAYDRAGRHYGAERSGGDLTSATYTAVAVGVDAMVNGRNNQGMVSLRYERRFGWGRAANTNSVTGVAHMSSAIIPETLRMDYGGYAGRTHIESNGAAVSASSDALTQVYSLYAGPTLTTHAGDVAITGHYHIGYTKIGSADNVLVPAGQARADIFDHSTVHDAKLAAGVRPGEVLPVGLSVEGGYYQEDVSNLAQRVKDAHVRGEITIPVADDVALVGGLGYEKTTVSSHNAVLDATGAPVLDSSGRLITDYTTPRYIAFDSDGLIWDVGVVWRPSRRTNMEVHVGRRYGEVGAYGFLTYQPNDRTSFNIVAYNNIAGFGGTLTNSLMNMPSQFSAVRDGITGNLTSCVSSSQSGGCLAGALGSANSTVYRGRGVSVSYGLDFSRIRTGIGAGWDRRQYIASTQTVLAALNGKVDQYFWAGAFVGATLTPHSSFETTVDAYHFQSGLSSAGDLNAIRAVGLYQYYFSHHLTASASLAIDGISRQQLDDIWAASGSVGMRYTF